MNGLNAVTDLIYGPGQPMAGNEISDEELIACNPRGYIGERDPKLIIDLF
jgi:hypothetical protein